LQAIIYGNNLSIQCSLREEQNFLLKAQTIPHTHEHSNPKVIPLGSSHQKQP